MYDSRFLGCEEMFVKKIISHILPSLLCFVFPSQTPLQPRQQAAQKRLGTGATVLCGDLVRGWAHGLTNTNRLATNSPLAYV